MIFATWMSIIINAAACTFCFESSLLISKPGWILFNNEKSLTDSLESSPLTKYITSKSLLDKPHSKPTFLFKAVTFLSNKFVFPH